MMSPSQGDHGAERKVEARPRRTREERKKRAEQRKGGGKPKGDINTLFVSPAFVLLGSLLVISTLVSFFLVLSHPEDRPEITNAVMHGFHKNDIFKQAAKVAEEEAAQVKGIKPLAAKDAPHDIAAQDDGDDLASGDSGDSGDSSDDETGKKAASPAQDDNEEAELPAANIENQAEKPAAKKVQKVEVATKKERFSGFDPELVPKYSDITPFDTTLENPHMDPKPPVLPAFSEVDNAHVLIDDLLHNNKPTIAGVIAFFNDYLKQLHEQNKRISVVQSRDATGQNIDEMYFVNSYFNLTQTVIDPLENAYRGRTLFKTRDDDSIFISLAAFREHLLGKSLMSAFDKAKDPSKLFIGAVVQNCFGLDGTKCVTGMRVVGKDQFGHDRASISPAPPDANGIEEFCTDPKYKKYCDSGQVRVIYVHDTDALGPQTARFYASKLWGGETWFMQMDAHLEFAPHWDQYYIDEAKAAKAYPNVVLSAYPPGFQEYDGGYQGGTKGARLCSSEFSSSPVEHKILRIGQLGQAQKDYPTQIPFIAAGFFFAQAEFLRVVPFDPYAPWCFMGEEIALSMRAWTQGWSIYAPRKNMIAHQYRPGRLGLPKFWESVGRDAGRASLNTRLQKHVIRRVKHMLTYPTDSTEAIAKDKDSIILHNFEHYSMGHNRTVEEYLQWTKINPVKLQTGRMEWCLKAELA